VRHKQDPIPFAHMFQMIYQGDTELTIEHPENRIDHTLTEIAKLRGRVQRGTMSKSDFEEAVYKGKYKPIPNLNTKNYDEYRNKVRRLSFKNLAQTDWFKGTKELDEVDHIVPVIWFYAMNLSVQIVSDALNLRYMDTHANQEKSSVITIDSYNTYGELLRKYPELEDCQAPPVGWLINTSRTPRGETEKEKKLRWKKKQRSKEKRPRSKKKEYLQPKEFLQTTTKFKGVGFSRLKNHRNKPWLVLATDGSETKKRFATDRQAARNYDLQLIRLGKQPVNVFKKKET
jgi:hypothetical protein